MIHHLRGRLVEKTPTHLVVECSGVGYQLEISLHTYSQLSESEEQFLYTHVQIKEDSHTLFGFLTIFERSIFRLLLSVSGIGASIARTMLSSLTPEEVVEAIASEQVHTIQSVKGIGAKTAQRLILELKDKVLGLDGAEDSIKSGALLKNSNADQAMAALEVLGFSRKAIQKTVEKLASSNAEMSVEDLIKNTLNLL